MSYAKTVFFIPVWFDDFEKIDNADKVFDFNYLINHRTTGKKVYVSICLYVVYKDAVGEIYGVLCKHDIEYEMPDSFFANALSAYLRAGR